MSEQAAGVVEYPYPLREGLLVRLVLPKDLSEEEAGRLAAFLMTLVVPK